MAQLIFDIAWQHHRVSDFFAQQLPIALTQSMERLLHGVLGHGQFTLQSLPAKGDLIRQ